MAQYLLQYDGELAEYFSINVLESSDECNSLRVADGLQTQVRLPNIPAVGILMRHAYSMSQCCDVNIMCDC
jgi:hypothetical protein